jgi:hypothetical protein
MDHLQWHDLLSGATFLVALGIYRKMSIMVYQHKLMWEDFAERKGISIRVNGKPVGTV